MAEIDNIVQDVHRQNLLCLNQIVHSLFFDTNCFDSDTQSSKSSQRDLSSASDHRPTNIQSYINTKMGIIPYLYKP